MGVGIGEVGVEAGSVDNRVALGGLKDGGTRAGTPVNSRQGQIGGRSDERGENRGPSRLAQVRDVSVPGALEKVLGVVVLLSQTVHSTREGHGVLM